LFSCCCDYRDAFLHDDATSGSHVTDKQHQDGAMPSMDGGRLAVCGDAGRKSYHDHDPSATVDCLTSAVPPRLSGNGANPTKDKNGNILTLDCYGHLNGRAVAAVQCRILVYIYSAQCSIKRVQQLKKVCFSHVFWILKKR